MTKQTFFFAAYDNGTDGTIHSHTGTLIGAQRKAKAYARDAFPASDYAGYGARWMVAVSESDLKLGNYLASGRL